MSRWPVLSEPASRQMGYGRYLSPIVAAFFVQGGGSFVQYSKFHFTAYCMVYFDSRLNAGGSMTHSVIKSMDI